MQILHLYVRYDYVQRCESSIPTAERASSNLSPQLSQSWQLQAEPLMTSVPVSVASLPLPAGSYRQTCMSLTAIIIIIIIIIMMMMMMMILIIIMMMIIIIIIIIMMTMMMMMMMMMMMIIMIIIIITFKGEIRDCATNRLQRTFKWPGRNRVQITSAYHVQHVVLRATWYEGTAQLLS